MRIEKCLIQGIPTVIWGEPSEKAYLFVHGKMSSKDAAALFAGIAQEKGCQTLSFDLPEHGDRAAPARPAAGADGALRHLERNAGFEGDV